MDEIREWWVEHDSGENCVYAHTEEEAVEYVRNNVSKKIIGVETYGKKPVDDIPDWINGQPTVVLN